MMHFCNMSMHKLHMCLTRRDDVKGFQIVDGPPTCYQAFRNASR